MVASAGVHFKLSHRAVGGFSPTRQFEMHPVPGWYFKNRKKNAINAPGYF